MSCCRICGRPTSEHMSEELNECFERCFKPSEHEKDERGLRAFLYSLLAGTLLFIAYVIIRLILNGGS